MNDVMRTAVLTVTLCATLAAVARADAPDPRAVEFFETKIRPLLADNCYRCHGEKKQMAGLRLDSRSAMLTGGDSGPILVAGDPSKSRIVEAIRQSGDLKMPPKGKLKDHEIDDLTA